MAVEREETKREDKRGNTAAHRINSEKNALFNIRILRAYDPQRKVRLHARGQFGTYIYPIHPRCNATAYRFLITHAYAGCSLQPYTIYAPLADVQISLHILSLPQ